MEVCDKLQRTEKTAWGVWDAVSTGRTCRTAQPSWAQLVRVGNAHQGTLQLQARGGTGGCPLMATPRKVHISFLRCRCQPEILSLQLT